MGDSPDVPSVAAFAEDPETRLAFLVDAGVLEIDEEDEVTTTVPYEDTRSIYADTYTDVSEGQLVETVVDLFDVPAETARERIEAEEVTPNEIATYLSLQSFLDEELPMESLALLVDMVASVGVGSPVPDSMTALTDEDYRDFIDETGDAVIFVWKYPCDPCRRMKGEIPPLLDALGDDVAIAGVDGESVPDFRREFDVETAPTVLLFADGELVDTLEAYQPVVRVAEAIAEAFDGIEVEVVDEA